MKRQHVEPKAHAAASRLRLQGRLSRLRLQARLGGSLLLSLGLVLGTAACTKTPQKPPDSSWKQAKKDSRLDQPEDLDPERRHLAPPPAYGNKVVMAQDDRTATHRF